MNSLRPRRLSGSRARAVLLAVCSFALVTPTPDGRASKAGKAFQLDADNAEFSVDLRFTGTCKGAECELPVPRSGLSYADEGDERLHSVLRTHPKTGLWAAASSDGMKVEVNGAAEGLASQDTDDDVLFEIDQPGLVVRVRDQGVELQVSGVGVALLERTGAKVQARGDGLDLRVGGGRTSLDVDVLIGSPGICPCDPAAGIYAFCPDDTACATCCSQIPSGDDDAE